MLTVGYARVSTEDQAFKQALQHQSWRLLDAGCDRVYADVASRSKNDRAGLEEMLHLIRSGQVKILKIVRLDRITSSPGLFESISASLKEHSVELQILDESSINIANADGEFSALLQVVFAKRELRTIQLRSQRGHQHRKRSKRASGAAPFGYRIKDGKYCLNLVPFVCLLSDRPETGEFAGRSKADLAKEIFETFFQVGSLQGTVRAIHSRYGIEKFKHPKPKHNAFFLFEGVDEIKIEQQRQRTSGRFQLSPDSLKVIIENPVYRGHTARGVMEQSKTKRRRRDPAEWSIDYNTHSDRVLTEQEYQEAIAIIRGNRKSGGWGWNPATKGIRYSVSGLLYCARCGSRMKVSSTKYKGTPKEEVRYQCQSYREAACTAKQMLRLSAAEEVIIEALVQRAIEIAQLADQSELEPDSPELLELRKKLEGLTALGYNPALEVAKLDLATQVKMLEHQQEQRSLNTGNLREMLVGCTSQPNYWKSLQMLERRTLFHWLVDRVEVASDPQKIVVKLNV